MRYERTTMAKASISSGVCYNVAIKSVHVSTTGRRPDRGANRRALVLNTVCKLLICSKYRLRGSWEDRLCLLGRKGAKATGICLTRLYMSVHPQADASCDFRDFFRILTAGRRDAYLSSSTYLPGSDIRHSPSGFDIRRSEDIYTTEAESAIELGCVVYYCVCALN
jgi:hypothetical protein